ncbi:hypothetical protein L6164_027616 [Bauhinia variegata]|nr:hypothetical protein L6164_027616 [Bauhinia variegata]
MRQGRISEAKETLCRVKPAIADGPRGSDSHLKAYERAQQMLKDLESEKLNKGGDRLEQSRLFEAFLGSSSIWQPQPCKDNAMPTANSIKIQDDFADENVNWNILANRAASQQNVNNNSKQFAVATPFGNSLNVTAPPFHSSKSFMERIMKEPNVNYFPESLKRTRSGNAAAGSMNLSADVGEINKLPVESGAPENKTRRLSSEDTENKLAELLPDNKDFEEALLAAVIDSNSTPGIFQRKIDKRLKVFQDITLSLSPRA